jgi:hypothetical protein
VDAETRSAEDPSGRVADLLLAEHREAYAMYRHSEELGERRVNFFITLTTAVIAALAIRVEGVTERGEVDVLFFMFLPALLLFGVLTLRRIILRNQRSSRQLRAVHRISAYFVKSGSEACAHLEFFDPERQSFGRERKWSQLFTAGNGGLAETVSLMNALLLSFLVGLIVYETAKDETAAFLAGAGALVAAWVIEFALIKRAYDRAD